jgi:hypothetical protein
MKTITFGILSVLTISTAFANTIPEIAIIDAGSSGTRLHVFQDNQGKLESIYEASNKDPISGYIYNTSAAATPVENLLKTAESTVKNIHNIPVYVYATAGMRYVPLMQQNEIYNSIKSTLSTDKYNLIQAKTISGEDEGFYDWISVNYLNGNLGTNHTSGAMDLGGASTQIAFTVNSPAVANKSFTYDNVKYNIYAKSFLGLGLDKAPAGIGNTLSAKKYCYPESYWSTELTHGSKSPYNNIDCQNVQYDYFQTNYNNLSEVPNILKNSTAKNYIAFSGFYYTSSFFGITGQSNLNDLTQNTNNACSVSWDNFVNNYGFNKYSASECLNSNYTQTLLKSYGFNQTTPIDFSDSINGQGIDWSTGAALFILNNNA